MKKEASRPGTYRQACGCRTIGFPVRPRQKPYGKPTGNEAPGNSPFVLLIGPWLPDPGFQDSRQRADQSRPPPNRIRIRLIDTRAATACATTARTAKSPKLTALAVASVQPENHPIRE